MGNSDFLSTLIDMGMKKMADDGKHKSKRPASADDRRGGRGRYDDMFDDYNTKPRPRRRRTDHDRRAYYSDSDSDSVSPRPRRRGRSHRDPYARAPSPEYGAYPRHGDRYRDDRRRYDEGGYGSDTRHNRPRPYEQPYVPPAREGERRRHRDDSYDAPRRDRRRNDGYGDDRGPKDGKKDWQKEAKSLFMTHAVPFIKKEGPRLVATQVAAYMAKKK